MKIAMIGQKGIPCLFGGVERHVEELSTRLVRDGHKVLVYARSYYTPKDMKEYKGVKIIHLSTVKSKYLDAIFHTLLSSIHVLFQDVDIIHFHAIGPSFLCFIPKIFKPQAKIITTFHCKDWEHQKWGILARLFLKLGAWMAVNVPDKTIVVSKTLLKYCKDKYGKDCKYIPNGVKVRDNSEQITDNSKQITEIRKFGLERNGYILTVARLIKHKGIHYLIKAYNRLKTSKKLVITGEGFHTDDYVKYLKNLARSNKNIIFTGFKTGQDLEDLFKNAYLYVHPSEAEGLPITILEAASFGKCILASSIPENKEALSGYGFTFQNKNVEDLKNKLEYLIQNPDKVQEQGERLQEVIQRNYDWGKIVEETEKLYEQVQISNLKSQMLNVKYK